MARYNPIKKQYPISNTEYHITTPSGVISRIFVDKEMALERFAAYPKDWKLVEVTLSKKDVTPENHMGTLHLSMSQAIIESVA